MKMVKILRRIMNETPFEKECERGHLSLRVAREVMGWDVRCSTELANHRVELWIRRESGDLEYLVWDPPKDKANAFRVMEQALSVYPLYFRRAMIDLAVESGMRLVGPPEWIEPEPDFFVSIQFLRDRLPWAICVSALAAKEGRNDAG